MIKESLQFSFIEFALGVIFASVIASFLSGYLNLKNIVDKGQFEYKNIIYKVIPEQKKDWIKIEIDKQIKEQENEREQRN